MGTLRKLGQALGLIKKDKNIAKHKHNEKQNTNMIQRVVAAIKEELETTSDNASFHIRRRGVPGAFGIKRHGDSVMKFATSRKRRHGA